MAKPPIACQCGPISVGPKQSMFRDGGWCNPVPQDLICRVAPDRACLRLEEPLLRARRVELVAPSPAAPVRVARIPEAVVHQQQEARRVALHEVLGARVLRAKRPLAADAAVTEGGRPLDEVVGLRVVGRERDSLVCEVTSGQYSFVSTI